MLLVLLSSIRDYIVRNYRTHILRLCNDKERYTRSVYATVLEKYLVKPRPTLIQKQAEGTIQNIVI